MQQPQDEHGVRLAYDEVADSYADHFRSTEPEEPVDLAIDPALRVPDPR